MQSSEYIRVSIFPFDNLSAGEGIDVFCRAFSTDLLTALSRFRQFRIMQVMESVQAQDHVIQEHFAMHPHGYTVMGTFRKDNAFVHLNVQLFENAGRHLVWGQRYADKLTNLLSLQEILLKGLVAALQHQIDADLLSKLRKRDSIEFSAYEHWLYGMEELKKASVEADLRARSHFQKAIDAQPDYALAYSGMSLSYFNEWSCQLWDRWEISKTGAFEWAQKAIELDEQNHVIALVLGRVFLYEGSYDTAEYYFRKSLALNSNDPDTLMQIAMYIVYLGLEKEALSLFERALQINPFHIGNQLRFGGFIYFEMGEDEKAEAFIAPPGSNSLKIADTDAYCAAIYYYLGKYDKMHMYWKSFLETYRRLLRKGNDFPEQEAIDWLLKLNPHRRTTRLEAFLRHIGKGSFQAYPLQRIPQQKKSETPNHFFKDSAAWHFSFDGLSVQVAEIKGFYDLRTLLMQPRQVFHCAELMGSTLESGGAKLMDEKARKQYGKKLLTLQADIQEAEKLSDYVQAEKLQEEYDSLVEHLSKSLGLKGKSRSSGSTVEKARSAVTWRIRHAIARIELHHPVLGAHLSNAVKTGTLCAYKPEREYQWVTA